MFRVEIGASVPVIRKPKLITLHDCKIHGRFLRMEQQVRRAVDLKHTAIVQSTRVANEWEPARANAGARQEKPNRAEKRRMISEIPPLDL